MWHLTWAVAAGTDATHAEHIETIKSRKYVGLIADQRFLPGKLGMGLVEGNAISILVVLKSSKNGLIPVICVKLSVTLFQGITQWGMRCLNQTWEQSWRLTLNLCQRAERTKPLSSVIMWPNTRLFLSSPWGRQRSESECSTAKVNEIYISTFVCSSCVVANYILSTNLNLFIFSADWMRLCQIIWALLRRLLNRSKEKWRYHYQCESVLSVTVTWCWRRRKTAQGETTCVNLTEMEMDCSLFIYFDHPF